MRMTSLVRLYAIVMTLLVAGAAPAVARINVNLQVDYSEDEGFILSNIERWDTVTGQKVLRYEIIDGYGGTPESVDAIAMGPDGYLYAAGNNLGNIDVVRLDTATGMTVTPPDYDCCGIDVPFATFVGGPVNDMMSDAHGDLLTAAYEYLDGVGGAEQGIIRRFDGVTGLPKGEIIVGNDRHAYSIDASPDGSYFYAMHLPMGVGPGGDPNRYLTKYAYLPSSNVFTEVANFVTTGSYINIGPDDLLYIGNTAANTVDRYNTNGQFLDQFIDEYVYDLSWLEGRLIGLMDQSRVVEIDPLSGEIIATLIDANLYSGPGTLRFYGMAAFSVVPEPSAACLLMCCLSAVAVRPQTARAGAPDPLITRHRDDAG